jgi:hypothetical protein
MHQMRDTSLMLTFQPAFAFWPRPRFLGISSQGLTAWIPHRNTVADEKVEQSGPETIKRIVEDHHDRHARTIFSSR